MSTKQYRPWAPDQPYLLPPSPSEWLPKTHFVYFLLDVLGTLDLKPIEAKIQAKDPRGNLPHPPLFMVGLLLYAYCRGVFSSRKIERAIMERVDFRVLAGGLAPDHVTIARFRRDYLPELGTLFLQVLKLCEQVGLARFGRVALDGSKLLANASKHKAMSYEYMQRREAELKREIDELLRQAETTDGAEDEEYGEGQCAKDIPDELARRHARLAKILEAKAALEEGARQARAEHLEALAEGNDARAEDESLSSGERKAARTRARKQRSEAQGLRGTDEPARGQRARDDESGPDAGAAQGDEPAPDDDADADAGADQGDKPADEPAPEAGADADADQGDESADESDAATAHAQATAAEMPSRKVNHTAEGKPDKRAQRNFTDPDSSIMEHKGGFVQAYNGQVISNEEQVVLAHGLSNCGADTHHMQPMMDRVIDHIGTPDTALADAGYWSPGNAGYCEDKGIDAYIATSRESKIKADQSGPDPPPLADPLERMRSKLRTPKGREEYRDRKWMVEPVFGQIKAAMGFRTFTMRGLEAARGEWGFVCTCHNLRKLYGKWMANGGLIPA